MKLSFKRGVAVLAAVLLLSVGAAMAAPSVDSTSPLADGGTIDDFNASANDQLPTLNASYATTKPEIQIIDPETGATIETFTNESDPGYFTQTGGSGPYYYNTTFNESDFATVPMDAGEEKNVTLRLIDNSSLGDPGSSDMTNITVTLNNTDERAVIRAGDTSLDDGFAEITSEDPAFWEIWASATEFSEVNPEGVGVGGDATTVYVVLENDSVADPFETAAEDKEGGWSWIPGVGPSDYSEGDTIKDIQVGVGDGSVLFKNYYEAAPDSVADKEEATYGVYSSLNGEPTQEIHLGTEDFDDETSVDVMLVGNQGYAFDVPAWGDEVRGYEDGGMFAFMGA